jgi:hypothetical protein
MGLMSSMEAIWLLIGTCRMLCYAAAPCGRLASVSVTMAVVGMASLQAGRLVL